MSIYRKIIFIALLGFLFLPLLQSRFHFIKLKKLGGTYTLSDDTVFTYQGWFSGKYQAHKEHYLRDTFGLRSVFIRVNNQVDFSLFRKSNAGDIVVGKNDDLFIDWYLGAYTGNDFAGTKSINSRLEKLKYIQDKLAEMHKTLLIVFAPSKCRLNPENIPSGYTYSDSANYLVYKRLIKSKGLNYIDFTSYFIKQKDKTAYALMPKYGTHWSFYGACIAGDSIITMLEKLKNYKMIHTVWTKNIVTEQANGDELELENELNLLYPMKHEAMGHPQIEIVPDSTKVKPSAMFIGDSFFWGIAVHYNIWGSFSSLTFAHYFKTIYPPGSASTVDIDNFNLKDEIKKDDIFVIEATEPNLSDLGWGFSDAMYKILTNDTAGERVFHDKVLAMRDEMKVKPDLMNMIAEKAKKKNIPVDSMLTLDAIWILQHPSN